jgi:uncharacterized repeat protein (TIGR03803 family)
MLDASGNLYGTTNGGGSGCSAGCGIVFEIAPDGTESVLYAFKGGHDGSGPQAGVVSDQAGDLYGTTYDGGGSGFNGVGCGTVYKLAANGSEKVLCALHGAHGSHPVASLFMRSNGLLYGSTRAGGAKKDGVVFSVKP